MTNDDTALSLMRMALAQLDRSGRGATATAVHLQAAMARRGVWDRTRPGAPAHGVAKSTMCGSRHHRKTSGIMGEIPTNHAIILSVARCN